MNPRPLVIVKLRPTRCLCRMRTALPSVSTCPSIPYPDARTTGFPPVVDCYRLFMVPGMRHCGGGAGPNRFGNGNSARSNDPEHDVFAALERWVERGVAPDRLVGTGATVSNPPTTLTRPLCPYPNRAVPWRR